MLIEHCNPFGVDVYYNKQKGELTVKNAVPPLWKDRKRILGLPISFTRYSISQERIFVVTGIFNLHYEEILLYRVRDLGLIRNFGQRIFGVGSVVVHSSDKSKPELEIKNVRHPMQVKELLHQQVEEMKLRRRVRVNELLDSQDGSLNEDDENLMDDFDDAADGSDD